MELPHGFVGVSSGSLEGLVGLIEFVVFVLLAGISAGNANARNGGLYVGVDLCDLFSRNAECLLHFSSHHNREEHHEWNHRVNNQGEPEIYRGKCEERTQKHDYGKKQVFRSVVRQFRNVHKVVYKTGHDGSRFVFVIEGEGELLKSAEHVLSHVALQTDAHHVSPIGNEEVQPHFCDIQNKYHRRPGQNKAQISVGNVFVDDVLGDDRIKQVCQGYQKGTEHIPGKKPFVGLVIFNKFSYHI